MPTRLNQSDLSSTGGRIADALSSLPTLIETGNGTNATNSSSEVNSTDLLHGYVRSYDVAIIAAVSAGIIFAMIGTWIATRRCYRKKMERKVEQAGNIQISMSRPNSKK
ncbi:hypothetical protein N0V93_008809 [Gnomoniopsis smithogilvyi]|uniref:Uncharacterized protein n=1 Tax=Gnomoniopsis smithogilvyi TaxID=1191159 RepID=A0A9W9CV44_9PEZI|nr:hypothetical protein N0V93_008809 [Gnomoniopsis smithogilvyi]